MFVDPNQLNPYDKILGGPKMNDDFSSTTQVFQPIIGNDGWFGSWVTTSRSHTADIDVTNAGKLTLFALCANLPIKANCKSGL